MSKVIVFLKEDGEVYTQDITDYGGTEEECIRMNLEQGERVVINSLEKGIVMIKRGDIKEIWFGNAIIHSRGEK